MYKIIINEEGYRGRPFYAEYSWQLGDFIKTLMTTFNGIVSLTITEHEEKEARNDE